MFTISQSPVASALQFLWPKALGPRHSDYAIINRVRDVAARLLKLPDTGMVQQTDALRQSVKTGRSALEEDLLVPAFALVVEATRRMLGLVLYDVQLLAGLSLSRGAIAEMQTGEGKTFAVLLPACVHGLSGNGVHVMTVNAYLAARDYELLAPVYRLLGFSAGLIQAEADIESKRDAYNCDITYGPGYEFGFDYLRDQLAGISRRKPGLGECFRDQLRGRSAGVPNPMQRGHRVAIVDEADSVMLDEATTPLVLAMGGGTPAEDTGAYRAAAKIAAELDVDTHFRVDQVGRLQLTRMGLERLAAMSDDIPRRGLARPWPVYVEQALRAEWLFREDVHYIIADRKIRIVDQYTGRIFADRSWRDGLEQAVQTKAGVTITTETKSVARITRQRFLRLYPLRCGMTGTAQGAERELRDLYGTEVVVIPPNKPCQRKILPTRVFVDQASKERALIADIVQSRRSQRPVLVGTAAIETSERLASFLGEQKINYQLLNGKQDAEEAAIVARAGQLDMVTIATNMAGRGTDIKLGPGVAELGGLHVVATEPQQSMRVDRQLVGRAARQGDPGSCQLFASADDDLFRRYSPTLSERMRRSDDASGEVRTNFDRAITELQRQVDREHAISRRQLFDHDDWLDEVLADLASSK